MQNEHSPPPPSNPLIKYLSIALAITCLVVLLLVSAFQLLFGFDAPYRYLGFDFMQALVASCFFLTFMPTLVLTLWGISRSERTAGRRLRWYLAALLFCPYTALVFWLGED